MKNIFLLAVCSLNLCASDLIIKGGGFVPHKLGNLDLLRTDNGYEILKGEKRIEVKNHDVDPLLKKLDKNKLAVFLKEGHGYTEISQLSNGDYKVKAHVRGEGSGPVTGMVFAWLVRAAMYTPAATAASVAVATTGPVGATAAASTIPAYICTVEGASAAAAIVGYSLVWLP